MHLETPRIKKCSWLQFFCIRNLMGVLSGADLLVARHFGGSWGLVLVSLVVVNWPNIKPAWYFLTLHDSVSGPWLHHMDIRPAMDLYGLLVTLPFLCFSVTVLSGKTCGPVMLKYQKSKQAIHTTQLYMEGNKSFINISDLTWTHQDRKSPSLQPQRR